MTAAPHSMRGPAVFLAQFMGDAAPFDTLDNAARWMAQAGYEGVQVPSNDPRCMDLALAAESQDYCDDLIGRCREAGVEITELSTHLQGQLVAVHPAFDAAFDNFAPPHLRGKPTERQAWAVDQLKLA
ncbi:MAG: AP endonuclease, partial [Sphingobium sp.]